MHELQVESNGSPQATTRSSRALNDEIRPFTDAKSHKNKVVLYGDMNLFTDREGGNTLNPSELDWIIGLALRFREDMEISVYRETGYQPLDSWCSFKNIGLFNSATRLMFPSGSGRSEAFGDTSLYTRRLLLFWMMLGQRLEYRQRSCGPVTSQS